MMVLEDRRRRSPGLIERREAGQSDHFLLSTRRAIIGEK